MRPLSQNSLASMTACVIAALWVVVPALSALHLALEDHVYCAEHGTLEEGSQVGHGVVVSRGGCDQIEAPDAERDVGLHRACAHGDLATRDDFDASCQRLTSGPVWMCGTPPVQSHPVPLAFGLLQLAPKTSPPLAA